MHLIKLYFKNIVISNYYKIELYRVTTEPIIIDN